MVKTIRTQHDIIHYPDVQNFTAYQHIISLLEFGHTHDSKGYYLSRETWPYAVFFYCGTGSGKIIYQGKNMYFTKGDTIILPAGTSHILISDPDDPFLVKWINASGPAVDNLMNTYDIFAPTVYPQVDTSGLITSYHASIESSLDAKEIISNTILLLTAIVHACALPDASSVSQKSSLAQMIKTCIDHHIQDSDLSVSKIADMLEIRLPKLTHVFQTTYGINPHAYITNRRIDSCKLMLRSTDLSIAEIAAAMGFSDSNYFFYFFKKHAGVSPGVFRRQSRREGDGLPT